MIGQNEESKITKKPEISSTSSENESDVDDSKEEQVKAVKEEWFDKRKKSKRKNFSLFFKKEQ